MRSAFPPYVTFFYEIILKLRGMADNRIFPSSESLQNFLLEEGSPHTLIIVPHQRLAHQVWHRQRLAHLAQGHPAWEPLRLLTLGAWWRDLARRLWLPQVPAPPLKRLALWRRALQAGPPPAGVQADLTWARALDEAYEILARHRLPLTEPRFGDPPLVAWRRRVARLFEERLHEEELLSPARLADILLKALGEGRLPLPEQVWVVGLETPAPLEEAWLNAAARRTGVLRLQIKGNPEAVREAYAFADPEEEMEWVVARLVEIHNREHTPLHRLAVTSPIMDDYAPRFRRVLAELLGPEEQAGGWAYNFSAGPTLAEAPLFSAALLPLKFAALGERREDLAALLLSPYYTVLKENRADVARWDRLFRAERLVQGWPAMQAAVGRAFESGELLDTLEQSFQALAGGPRPVRVWLAGLQDGWRRLGFPGELSAAEVQQYGHLQALCRDLAQALPQETLAAPELLEWLGRGAGEAVLPGPGVQEAGLQILGLLEMRVLDFDRVFCLGMNSGVLPAPPRPLALLSLEEKAAVLGATYASQHRFAADLYANLLGTAPHLTLTRPFLVNDEEQVGTPLYAGRWEAAPDWRPILSRPHAAWLLAPPVKAAFTAEPVASAATRDPEALSLPLPQELRVTQLQTALACPCRFLLEVLLAIPDLPDIEAGLPPLERGALLHQLLARFVKRFGEVLAADPDWQDALAWEILRDTAHELLGPRLTDPHWQAELERWLGRDAAETGLLAAWLSLEKVRYHQGWRWQDAELPFQGLTRTGWPFSLKGRIDRLDFHPESGEALVWDYKSGAVPSAVSIFERLEDCQLPAYLAAVQEAAATPAPASLRAGYIGLKSTRREHLRHQDFGKTAAQWDDVLRAWEEQVAVVVRRLQAGDFQPDPRPAPVKATQGACAYCCYALLCGFTPEEAPETESEVE
jgi:ATP-dependent helicase/nuclease subunit B